MKEKTPISIFILTASVWLSASVCVVGIAKKLVGPIVPESFTSLAQPQPFDAAPEVEFASWLFPVDASDNPFPWTSVPAQIRVGQQDQRSIVPLDQTRALTVLPPTASGVDPDVALGDMFHPFRNAVARSFLSRLLKHWLGAISPNGFLPMVADGLSIESRSGMVQEPGAPPTSAASPSETEEMGLPVFPPYTRECLCEMSFHSWLAATCPATVMTLDELHSDSLRTRALSRLEPIIDRKVLPEPARPQSRTATAIEGTVGILAATFAAFGLVMIGNLEPTRQVVANRPHHALRIWDLPFKGSKDFPIGDEKTEITIGSNKFDTIYNPDLVASHVRIEVGQDCLTLTWSGPVQLADRNVPVPDRNRPVSERFQIDQEVSFLAGESVFVLERVPRI
jgi:hypothetical protein